MRASALPLAWQAGRKFQFKDIHSVHDADDTTCNVLATMKHARRNVAPGSHAEHAWWCPAWCGIFHVTSGDTYIRMSVPRCDSPMGAAGWVTPVEGGGGCRGGGVQHDRRAAGIWGRPPKAPTTPELWTPAASWYSIR